MPSLFRLFAALPLWLLHLLGASMGWLAFACSPSYRRRFLSNARQAGFRFGQVHAAVGHAGRMVAELPRMWLGELPSCDMVNEACAERAFARGKGVVFLTPHMGCFELSVQEAARRWAGIHGGLTVLYRPARQPWLAQVMESARNRPGVQAVPTTLSGVRQMIKALRRGEGVGLLPDQVPPEGLGIWSPFFGRQAYTMTLAARLALQTGATVILARCERKPWARGYVLYLEELSMPLSESLPDAVQQINQAMEHVIAQCPQQYLWGYARYKQPRADKAAAPVAGEQA